MTSLFTPILALHIACGLAATAVGLVPIFTRKGSRPHRLGGRAFAILMSVLLACAWVMTTMRFSAYLAGLSATATMAVFSGLRVLGRKRPDLFASDRAKPLDWALTSAVVVIGAYVAVLALTGRAGEQKAVALALAYGALVYGAWDLWRFAAPTSWPFSPNLWKYEHLLKMLGAYGAVMAAFSGNFLTFIPAPWSQLWPSLLFQTLSIGWIATLILSRRAPRPSIA